MSKRINKKIALAAACLAYACLIATPVFAKIENPLAPILSIDKLIEKVIEWVLGLAALLALLALIWGGIKMIIDFGGEESVKEGKKIIKWAIIGLLVVAGAYVIVRTVAGILGVTTP